MKKVDSHIKQSMYAKTIQKRDRAYKSEYFYETIMLDYALIEDRLNEFLKHLGIVNESDKGLQVTKRTRKSIRLLLNLDEKKKFGIDKIYVKLGIITKICEYSGNDVFLSDLHSIIVRKIGTDALSSLMKKIEVWKDKRNSFVHGLLNQVPSELDETIKKMSVEGKPLFRELDKYCRRIEKCNIRKKYRIQP